MKNPFATSWRGDAHVQAKFGVNRLCSPGKHSRVKKKKKKKPLRQAQGCIPLVQEKRLLFAPVIWTEAQVNVPSELLPNYGSP